MHQLLFFVLVLLCTLGSAKIQKGNILLKSDWHFIDKFCFDTHGLGNLTWTAWSPDASNLRLLFYDDQDNSWPEVYPKRHSLSCDEKIAMAKGNRSIVSGVTHFQEFKDTKRPHFWYMVVSNCGGASKVEFQYKFEFVNGGGAWDRQFSFEEQGLPQMYLFYWLVFVVIVVVHARGVWVLFQEKAFHPIVKLLTATIALQFFSLLFLFSHYAAYAKDGVGASGLKGLGELIDMASQLTFMVLLLLLSKGWSITRVQLTGQRILLILVSIMFILYITLFTVDNVTRNVATTFYLYESVPGILLLVMRSLVFLWFLWNLRLTFLDEIHPEKRKFYLIFGGVYSLWFLMLVLIVIIAACFGAYSYWRLKVVTGMYLTVNTLGFSIMAFLLWPSRATQYFQITQPDLLIPSGGQNSFTSNTHYDTL